jgi:SAM-dependent methyltransferase
MKQIDPNSVANRYNELDIIIDEEDRWHLITEEKIKKFIYNGLKLIPNSKELRILNAGSAGNGYGLPEENMLHVDLADKHLKHLSNSIVANIEKLPLPDLSFDLIICVGSVLNYCDPLLVANEFTRVLKSGGYIIIEFECSCTFELLGTKDFNKSAVFVETFFDSYGGKEKIWYFSENYIQEVFHQDSYSLIKRSPFHILSPAAYRMTNNLLFSSFFSKLDGICSAIPILNKFGSNILYMLHKKN